MTPRGLTVVADTNPDTMADTRRTVGRTRAGQSGGHASDTVPVIMAATVSGNPAADRGGVAAGTVQVSRFPLRGTAGQTCTGVRRPAAH
jgi:hypothetical protein